MVAHPWVACAEHGLPGLFDFGIGGVDGQAHAGIEHERAMQDVAAGLREVLLNALLFYA